MLRPWSMIPFKSDLRPQKLDSSIVSPAFKETAATLEYR